MRTYAVTHPRGLGLSETSYDRWDQLAYAARGVIRVTVGKDTWVIPPNRAVWIPSGTTFRAKISGRVALRTLYFRRGLARRRLPQDCKVINVTPLLRELILHASRRNTVSDESARDVRMVRFILDQIQELAVMPLRLEKPSDPRARKAADAIIRNGGTPEALEAALDAFGLTRRTLERLFVADMGVTLGRWCHRVRMMHALTLLAEGNNVTTVALKISYNSPSAFIAAFRREFGVTPARYFA